MSVENVEHGMEHLSMRDDGDEYSGDEVDELFALSDDEGAQRAIASSSGGGAGEAQVDLGALITMESLESPESHAVLKELSIKCTKAHPFASVPSGGHLPTYIMFDEGAGEQMDWELEMGSARPAWRHHDPKVQSLFDVEGDVKPVFHILTAVIPAKLFKPGQATIGDMQTNTVMGRNMSTVLYFLLDAMSNAAVGTADVRLVDGIPFRRYADTVTVFGRTCAKVSLLIERLVRDNAGIGGAEDVTEELAAAQTAAHLTLNRADNMAAVRFTWLVHDPGFDPNEAIFETLRRNAARHGITPQTGAASVADEFVQRMFKINEMSGEQLTALEKQIGKANKKVQVEERASAKKQDEEAPLDEPMPLTRARRIATPLAFYNCILATYMELELIHEASPEADLLASIDIFTLGAPILKRAHEMITFKQAFAPGAPFVKRQLQLLGVCALQCDDEDAFFDLAHDDPDVLAACDRHGLTVFSPHIPECVSVARMEQSRPEYIHDAPPPWNTILAVEAKLACYELLVNRKERARLDKKNAKRRNRRSEEEARVLQAHDASLEYLEATHASYEQWDRAEEGLSESERGYLRDFRAKFRMQADDKREYLALGSSAARVGLRIDHRRMEVKDSGGAVTLRTVSPLEAPRARAIELRKHIARVIPHLDERARRDLLDSFQAQGLEALEALLVMDPDHTSTRNTLIERYHDVVSEERSVCYGKVHPHNIELANSFLAYEFAEISMFGVTNGVGATRDFVVSIHRSSTNRDTEMSLGIGDGTIRHTVWIGQHGIGKSYDKKVAEKKMFVKGTLKYEGTSSLRANTDMQPEGDGGALYDEAPEALMGAASSTGKKADPALAAKESEWKEMLSEGRKVHSYMSITEGRPGMTHEDKAKKGRQKTTIVKDWTLAVSINANCAGQNKSVRDRFSFYFMRPQVTKGRGTSGLVTKMTPSFERAATGGIGAGATYEEGLTRMWQDRQMLNTLFYMAMDTGYVNPPNIAMWNLWNPVQRNLAEEYPSLGSSTRKLTNIPQAVAIQEAILYGIEMYQTAYVSGGFRMNKNGGDVKALPFELSHLQLISKYAYLPEATVITSIIRHVLTDLIPAYYYDALVLLAEAFCGYTVLDEQTTLQQRQGGRTQMSFLNVSNADTGTHDIDYEIVTGPARWHDIMKVLCEPTRGGHNVDTAKEVLDGLQSLQVVRKYASGYCSTPDQKVYALQYIQIKDKKRPDDTESSHGEIRISLTALRKCAPNYIIGRILKTIKGHGFRTHSHLSTPENPVSRTLLTGVENRVDQHVIGTMQCDLNDNGAGANYVVDYRDHEEPAPLQRMIANPDPAYCVTEQTQQLCQRKKDREYASQGEDGVWRYPELEKRLDREQLQLFAQLDRETRDSLAYNVYTHGMDFGMAYAHTPLMLTKRNVRLQEILFKKKRAELERLSYPACVIADTSTTQNRGRVRGREAVRAASRAYEKRIWRNARYFENQATADRNRYVARTMEEAAAVIPAGAAAQITAGQTTQVSGLTVEMNRSAAAKLAAINSSTGGSLTNSMFGFD